MAAYQPAETFPRRHLRQVADLFARCPDNTGIQGHFMRACAVRQASDLNPVRIFHGVLLETRFAQEVSVRS